MVKIGKTEFKTADIILAVLGVVGLLALFVGVNFGFRLDINNTSPSYAAFSSLIIIGWIVFFGSTSAIVIRNIKDKPRKKKT